MIPDSVNKILPKEGKEFYTSVFNKSFSRLKDSGAAHKVAWSLTKSKFRNTGGVWVANAGDFVSPQLYTFELSPVEGEVLVVNAGDDIILNAVLATTETQRVEGGHFTEVELEELAAQINSEGSTLPDKDHETLIRLRDKYGNNVEAIKREMRKEKGLFTKIKAAVKDGKLWIQAWLDKRYQSYRDHFKRLSIEALAVKDSVTGRLHKPKYLGFTFADKLTPQLPGAVVVD